MVNRMAVVVCSILFGAPAWAANFYDVPRLASPPDLRDNFASPAWGTSTILSGEFHFPWELRAAPATRFRAGHDDTNLYFAFDVDDPDVVVLDKAIGKRETVDVEDRVELFFAPGAVDKPLNGKLPPYYAVEVDPAGRVNDYSVVYYRNFDGKWTMPGLGVFARRTNSGYAVNGLIPLASLRGLGLIDKDGLMRTGVYRAEFSGKQGALNMEWISWVDPHTPEPDFHVDASFGTFRLLELK